MIIKYPHTLIKLAGGSKILLQDAINSITIAELSLCVFPFHWANNAKDVNLAVINLTSLDIIREHDLHF